MLTETAQQISAGGVVEVVLIEWLGKIELIE